MKRILVTGSRDWTDHSAVIEALQKHGPGTLVHGDCRGLDRSAARIAQELGWPVEAWPANWIDEGPAAGPKRNQRMVNAGADVCLAFPLAYSKGTWDCVRRAEAAGIPVFVFKP